MPCALCMRSDNICGRAQGIAAGLQAYKRYKALLEGMDIAMGLPEDKEVRDVFEKFMEPAMLTPSKDKKVRVPHIWM